MMKRIATIPFTLSSIVLYLSSTAACLAVNLTTGDVTRIIAQGEQAAQTLSENRYTIAVVDRVGNVLAVYRRGTASVLTIASGLPVRGGLEGVSSRATGLDLAALAAISKAVTGAYLSSAGNAFSSRTAGFIVQDHFAPGVRFTPGGPLFGAQFSQLPCGDLVQTADPGNRTTIGPRRAPLGLAADPGGFPLYKRGQVVGGVGVIAGSRATYGIDLTPRRPRIDLEERIALAAATGYRPPTTIRADRIFVNGLKLPYSTSDGAIPRVTRRTPVSARAIAVAGFTNAAIKAGKTYGRIGSGISPATRANSTPGLTRRGAYILENGNGKNRYAPRGNKLLPSSHVAEILQQALGVANQTRAQIRRPRNARAQVTVSVVDVTGRILGMARSADAPMFGTDVSLQKARTAVLFSRPGANTRLRRIRATSFAGIPIPGPAGRISAAQNVLGNVFNGQAFSARAIGNISRPYFPDGVDGRPSGPLSNGDDYSVFNVGLQLDLVEARLLGALVAPTRRLARCTTAAIGVNNGIQIFPGGMPIYRGNRLVGGVGVSGDGVDQDDMIAFLGLQRASSGRVIRGSVGHPRAAIRADQLGLRYVQCPQTPFVSSSRQNVCGGF